MTLVAPVAMGMPLLEIVKASATERGEGHGECRGGECQRGTTGGVFVCGVPELMSAHVPI